MRRRGSLPEARDACTSAACESNLSDATRVCLLSAARRDGDGERGECSHRRRVCLHRFLNPPAGWPPPLSSRGGRHHQGRRKGIRERRDGGSSSAASRHPVSHDGARPPGARRFPWRMLRHLRQPDGQTTRSRIDALESSPQASRVPVGGVAITWSPQMARGGVRTNRVNPPQRLRQRHPVSHDGIPSRLSEWQPCRQLPPKPSPTLARCARRGFDHMARRFLQGRPSDAIVVTPAVARKCGFA